MFAFKQLLAERFRFVDKSRTKMLAKHFMLAHQNCEYLEVGIGLGPDTDCIMSAISKFTVQRRVQPEFANKPAHTETISCELIDEFSGQSRVAFALGHRDEVDDFRFNAACSGDLFLKTQGQKRDPCRCAFGTWIALMNSLRPIEERNKMPWIINGCELQTFTEPNVLAVQALKSFFDESIDVSATHYKLGPEAPNRFHWKGNCVRLERKAWDVLNALWHAPKRIAEAIDLLDTIWGDDGNGRDRDGRLRGTQHVIRKTFEPFRIPYRIAFKGKHVLLKER